LDVLLEKGGSIDEITVTGGGARLSYWGELLAAAPLRRGHLLYAGTLQALRCAISNRE
jgi:sugar (pentulose or hexulose) kinase